MICCSVKNKKFIKNIRCFKNFKNFIKNSLKLPNPKLSNISSIKIRFKLKFWMI